MVCGSGGLRGRVLLLKGLEGICWVGGSDLYRARVGIRVLRHGIWKI